MNLKIVTFSLGLLLLLVGALTQNIPDWDIGVSIVLATYTFLTAEWAVTALWKKEYKKYPVAILSVLAPYALYVFYWTVQGKESVMIPGNLYLVVSLYLICGTIWAFHQKHLLEIQTILSKMVDSFRARHQ